MRRRLAGEAGFTILELLIASAIMMAAVAALFTVLSPAEGTFQAQPEVSDMQQRMRVAVDSLTKGLNIAGAGIYSGPAVGALDNFFAPVMPFRIGASGSDPVGTFRTDAITVLGVPETCAQTTISQSMPRTSNEIKVNAEPGCPPNDSLCCFEEGMQVIIFDHTGAWNTFVITNVQEPALHLQRHGPDFQKDYDEGAIIGQVMTFTYYLKSDDASETYQLMYYDGFQTDLPLVDNVVGLRFDYLGEPRAPVVLKPVSDPVGPWTSYGPKPPPLGVSGGMGWPDGENCLFQVSGGQQVSRLPELTAGATGLVPLTQAMLTDGPWCPGPDTQARFDADLLRIRQIRVTLRVQAGLKMLRGPTGPLFTKGGWARGGEMYVPDQELHFDITPRNLNLGR
jgi:hypothetical protein